MRRVLDQNKGVNTVDKRDPSLYGIDTSCVAMAAVFWCAAAAQLSSSSSLSLCIMNRKRCDSQTEYTYCPIRTKRGAH